MIVPRNLIFSLWLVLPTTASAAGLPWRELLKKDDAWFRSEAGRTAIRNILSNRSPVNDWPKNFDTSAKPFEGDRSKIKGTFDNGATVGEIRVLARVHRVLGDSASREACLAALDHVLDAQYPNGGWPQSFPPGKGYPRHITFNDNTFVNLMELARDAAERKGDWTIVDAKRAERCRVAFKKGIDCVLNCQVKVGGKLTAWCAQHDEITFEPRPARTYELPSLSGGESAGLLRLLMFSAEQTPKVHAAIEAGVAWYDRSKIERIRVVLRDGDKIVEDAPGAPPVWARFYEIDTGRPVFCGRDGVKKYRLAEIEKERRTGYGWYGNWGDAVAKDYRRWKGN